MRASWTVMLLTEAFPVRGTSPAELKPTLTESPDGMLPTVNEARSFPTVQNAGRGAKQVLGKGRTELHEQESTMNGNKNPKEGRQACLRSAG